MEKNNSDELDLIKNTLTTDLDESSVDIFSQDIFAPQKPAETKKAAAPRQAPEQKAQPQAPKPQQPIKSPAAAKEEKQEREIEIKLETGELKSFAAAKEPDKLDETEESLTQLEKMTGDFMSITEVKKLFKNMNLMIDMLNEFLVRLERMERKLKEKGILKNI